MVRRINRKDLLSPPASAGDKEMIYGVEVDKEIKEKYKIDNLNEKIKNEITRRTLDEITNLFEY
jgi:hypothetical protein